MNKNICGKKGEKMKKIYEQPTNEKNSKKKQSQKQKQKQTKTNVKNK